MASEHVYNYVLQLHREGSYSTLCYLWQRLPRDPTTRIDKGPHNNWRMVANVSVIQLTRPRLFDSWCIVSPISCVGYPLHLHGPMFWSIE